MPGKYEFFLRPTDRWLLAGVLFFTALCLVSVVWLWGAQ
jgi:hypothetical protein